MEKVPPGCTLVALPYVSKVGFTAATVQSLCSAITSGGLSPARILWLGDHSQTDARNKACEAAIERGVEYLFFIDSDMDFPPDTLKRLKACNADVACTDMWSRNWPSFRTVMRLTKTDEKGWTHAVPVSDSDLPPKIEARGIEDVDVCGMACTLIRTDFLIRFRDEPKFKDQPWFWTARHGEDATFCFNAKEIGAKIRCDFGVVAGHWGVTRMTGQDYTRDRRNQPLEVTEEAMMRRMGVLNLPKQEGAVK